MWVQVTVLRDGKRREMSVFDLLVGDVLFVGYGDILAVDGILIEGNSIRYPELLCTVRRVWRHSGSGLFPHRGQLHQIP
jgi:hypothetical protein